MKLNIRILTVLLVFLILFLCIGSVSALEDQTGESMENELGVGESPEILAESEGANLQATGEFGSSVVIDSISDGVYNTTAPHVSYNVVNKTTVTFTINKTDGTLVVPETQEDKLDSELLKLDAGSYRLSIFNAESSEFNASSAVSDRFIVYKASSSIDVDTLSIYNAGQAIVISLTPVNSTGAIVVTINGENCPIVNNEVNIDNGLAGGTYIVNAVLGGDDNYEGSSDSKTFIVVKNDIMIEVADIATPIVVDTPVTFTANLNESVTGDVIFTINGANYTKHIVDTNIATYQYTPVNNDTISVVATFVDNGKYNGRASSQKDFVVKRIVTHVQVSVNSPMYVEDAAIIWVYMDPNINAIVHLTVGTKPYEVAVVNGVGNYYVTGLADPTYNIEAVFDGDERYENSTNTTTLEVNAVVTDLSISLDKESISVGDKAVVSVVLNQSINNCVTVKVNGNNNTVGLVSGKGSFTLSDLPNGTYEITAVFAGDSRYLQDTSNTVFLEVNKIATEIGVSVATPVVYGRDAVITVELNATIDTAVKLNIDGNEYNVSLVKGKGVFNASGLTYGNHEISAVFDGDDKYVGDDDAKTFTVLNATLPAEVTALNVTVEENTKFIIDVADDFKGNVSIKVGNDLLYNGTFNSLITGAKLASAGEKTATVVFYGDNNYNITSVPVKFNVTRVVPGIEVLIDDVVYPADAVASINVGNNANGTVNITLGGGKKFNGTVYNGVANVHLKGLAAGIKEALIEFFTTDEYNENVTASAKFIVYPNNSLIEIWHDQTYYVGEEMLVNITISNSTGDVNVYLNGQLYPHLASVGKNSYQIDFNGLDEGEYTVSVVLDGDENYTGYDTSTTIDVVKKDFTITVPDITTSIIVGKPVILTAELMASVSGDVIFNIAGINYTVHVANGNIATYEYTPVDNTTLTVVATFMGNNEYKSNSSAPNVFEVNRIHTDINVSTTSPIEVGENAVVIINMIPTINTNVKLRINGKTYDVAIINGVGTYNVSGLARGDYEVNVTFDGDKKYDKSDNSTTLNVGYTALVADAVALNVTVGENTSFVINTPADFNGNVSIKVGDDVLYNGTVKTVINAAKLLAGNKTATVVFYGDGNYDELILNNVNFTVSRVIPAIDVTIADVTYPIDAVATISIGNNANGTVKVTVGDKVFDYEVTGGLANIQLNNLSAGSKVANVEFFTNDDYNCNATANVKFTVNKANSTIVIDVEKVYVYNDTIIINLTATGSKGAVNTTINGKVYPVTNNKQVIIENIAAGEYTIIANLDTSENYTAASNTTVFKVKKAATDVSIAVESTYKVGQEIVISLTPVNSNDLTVTINGKAVDVYDNKVTISGGLEVGEYIVTAFLAGNENLTESQDTKSFKVFDNKVNITLSDVGTIFVGSPVTFTANLNETLSGDVIFDINGIKYTTHVSNNNKATYQYTPADDSPITVVATFADTGDVSNQKQFNVNRISTSIDVTVNSPIVEGGDAEIKINMNPGINGIVKLTVGDKSFDVAVINGVGTYTISNLAEGSYNIKAAFNGDTRYSGSTSATKQLVVNQVATDLSVSIDKAVMVVGDKAVVSVVLSPSIDAIVTVKVNNNDYDVAVVNGKGDLTLSDLGKGTYTINAAFNGDGKYTSSISNALTLAVSQFATSVSVDFDSPISVGDEILIKINMNPGIDGIVKLIVGDKSYYVAVVGGVGNYTVSNLINATYNVEAVFAGDDEYSNCTSAVKQLEVNKLKTQITANPTTTTYDANKDMVITLKDVNNQYLVDKNVVVVLDGVKYAVTTDGKGQASVTVPANLTPKVYAASITFAGDGKYIGSANTTKVIVNKASSTIIAKKATFKVNNVKKYTVTLKSDSKAISNAKVTLKVGQTTYKATTDDNGKAKFNLKKLTKKGSYSAVIKFAGNDYYKASSNKIVKIVVK